MKDIIYPDKDNRSEVYDLFGQLSANGIEHAKHLFVLGGNWAAGGYFFEKQSAEYLLSLIEVPIYNEQHQYMGSLHDKRHVSQVFYAGNAIPKWIEEGKKYFIGNPKVSEEDYEVLWKMGKIIHNRLKSEGQKAGNEFQLIGTAMGSKAQSAEEILESIRRILGNS